MKHTVQCSCSQKHNTLSLTHAAQSHLLLIFRWSLSLLRAEESLLTWSCCPLRIQRLSPGDGRAVLPGLESRPSELWARPAVGWISPLRRHPAWAWLWGGKRARGLHCCPQYCCHGQAKQHSPIQSVLFQRSALKFFEVWSLKSETFFLIFFIYLEFNSYW